MRNFRELKNIARDREADHDFTSSQKLRMHNKIARNLQQTNTLTPGRCNKCGVDTIGKLEGLLPVVMTVCQPCIKRLLEITAGKLRIIKSGVFRLKPGYCCDNCGQTTYLTSEVNPDICWNCMGKLAHNHTTKYKCFKKEAERYQRIKIRIKREEGLRY